MNPEEDLKQQKIEATDCTCLHSNDPKHHYDQNMWFRYVRCKAKKANRSEFYVCVHMPHSAGSSLLRVQDFNDKICLIASATHPGANQNDYNANFKSQPPKGK